MNTVNEVIFKTADLMFKEISSCKNLSRRIHHKLEVLTIAAVVYGVVLNIKNNNQNKKIKQLEKDIEELKHKGE